MSDAIDDICLDALAGAVQHGISYIGCAEASGADWHAEVIAYHGKRGAEMLADGTFVERTRNLSIGADQQVALALGALALQPGGFRLLGIVFCAKHYPAGTDARTRFACPKCDPDARQDSSRGSDPRSVVTIEGGI